MMVKACRLCIMIVAILVVAFGPRLMAGAPRPSPVVKLWIGSPVMAIGTTRPPIDAGGASPVIVEGRTLVPIRGIIEAFHGLVSWDTAEGKATVTLAENTVELWADKSAAKLNGIALPIDLANKRVMPIIVSGRIMLPLRFVAESLSIDVQYEPAFRMITLTRPQNAALLRFLDLALRYLPLIAAVFGSIAFLFIYVGLSGRIQLRVVPQWVNDNQQVILRLEVANRSRVQIQVKAVDSKASWPIRALETARWTLQNAGFPPEEGSITLVILEYDLQQDKDIPEWIPFSKGDRDKFMADFKGTPLMPKLIEVEGSEALLPKPIAVFTTTQRIWVGDTLRADFLHRASPLTFLHAGLQFIPPSTVWTHLHLSTQRRTTTCFVFPPKSAASRPRTNSGG